MNGNLEGYLVGYGIEHRDGSVDETWLKEPKHNTITKHMLNNLLMYNGSNALTTNWTDNASLWVSAGGTRTGVLNYGAYGDGNAATTTNDIALKNKRSEYSSTKKTGAPYCGSYANSRTGVFSLRVTYQFAAAAEDIVIRELGIFHKVEPSGDYSLTARVVPDKPISVLTGDTFYFTYQLNISFEHSYVYKNIDGNGMDMKKVLNIWFYHRDNSDYRSSDDYGDCFAGVKLSGIGSLVNTSSSGNRPSGCRVKAPIYGLNNIYKAYYDYYSVGNVAYPYTSSFSLPPTTSYFATTNTADPNAYVNLSTLTIKSYALDSFYREYDLHLLDNWATDCDIYGFLYNGDAYQFGHDDDGVWTPSYLHKNIGKEWIFTLRQSWSAGDLHPTA